MRTRRSLRDHPHGPQCPAHPTQLARLQPPIRKKRVFLWFISALLSGLLQWENVIGDEPQPVKRYCKERDKLISLPNVTLDYLKETDGREDYLNITDDPFVVDAEMNFTIVLECKFCDEESKNEHQRLWYWQDLNESTEAMSEVELGMDNNITQIHLHMTADYTLIIRNFAEEDVGIYRCIGEKENRSLFTYRLEPVFQDEAANSTQRGNETEWKKYQETNLLPVTRSFAESEDEEFLAIREEGVTLRLVSDWGVWGPCEECVKQRGFKLRRAHCRIQSHVNEVAVENQGNSWIVQFFVNAPLLPCRSRILRERFPSVSNATRHLTEFVLVEKCKHCKKEKKPKKNKFKYKKRYLLAERADLVLPCPEATILSDVVWRKESLVLAKGKSTSLRKIDTEPRIFVDPYYTLYLKDVSKFEQGNYSCTVDGVRMLQAKITVAVGSRIEFDALLRHLRYLAFMLLMTSVAYCYELVNACKNSGRFRIRNYEQLMEEKGLLTS